MTPYDRADLIVGELKHKQESTDYFRGRIADAISAARLEALEEAAKIVESLADANIMNGPCEKVYAEAIRELGKK